MAISLHTAGSWVAATATTQTVTLPTHSTGDMLIVRVGAKHATFPPTITCATRGWNKLGQKDNAGGASSNGGGGVCVAVFWKIAASAAEASPVITFHASTAATPSAAVAMAYSKGATELWATPLGAGGDIAAATSYTATMASHIAGASGDLIDAFAVTNDNTTLTVPTFTQAGLTLDTVVESPAAALSDATSNDIAADGCYRIATAGTSSAAAVVTGTNSVADPGVAWTTRLRVGPNETAYRDKVAALGATSHFALGEGSGTFADTIGSLVGTATGTPTRDVANSALTGDDGGVAFPTTSDYITVPDNALLDLGDTFSIAFFFTRTTDSGGNEMLLNKGTNGYSIGIAGGLGEPWDDSLFLGKTGVNVLLGGATNIAAGSTVYHAVVTRNGTGLGNTIIYLDGVAETMGGSSDVGTALADTTAVLEIGREGAGSRWAGMLDELSIFKSVVLSAADVAALYASRTVASGTTGTAASTFSFSESVTATEDIPGTGASSFVFVPDASGAAGASGTAASEFPFSHAASGAAGASGTAASEFLFSLSANAAEDIPGAAASDFTFSHSATAAEDIPGTAASEFLFSHDASGAAGASGSAASDFLFSTAVTAAEDIPGTGASEFLFSTSSEGTTGSSDATGTSDVAFGFSASVTASEDIPGAGASTFVFVPDASGAAGASGAAASDFAFSAAATATEDIPGTGASTFLFSSGLTGTEDIPGVSASSFPFSHAATGDEDIPGVAASAFPFATAASGDSVVTSMSGVAASVFGFAAATIGILDIPGLVVGGDVLDVQKVFGVRYPWYAKRPRRPRPPVVSITGLAASAFGFSLSIAGFTPIQGSAASAFGFALAAAGSSASTEVLGSAASSFLFSHAGTASEGMSGSSAASFAFSQAATGTAATGVYFIAPSGSDTTGAGTFANPWRTITKFHSAAANPGDTLYCRGGTYQGSDIGLHVITKAGATNAYITIMSYPGETAVFNCASPSQFGSFLYFANGARFWIVDGIHILNVRGALPNGAAAITSSADTVGNTGRMIWRNMVITMANNQSNGTHGLYAGGNVTFVEAYGNDIDGYAIGANGDGFTIFHTDGADNVYVHHNIFRKFNRGVQIADLNANNITVEHNTFFGCFTNVQVDPGGSQIVIRSNAGVSGTNANIYDGGSYIDLQGNNVWGLVVPTTLNTDGSLPAGSPAIGAGHDGQDAGI